MKAIKTYRDGVEKRRDKNGRIRYRARVRLNGVSRSQTFSKLADARQWILQSRHDHERGHLQVYTSATLAETIERYLDTPEFAGKADKTCYQQRQQLGWWHSHYGPLQLAGITTAWLSARRDDLLRVHGPSTVSGYLSVLKRVCTLASTEWQLIPVNPFQGLKMPPKPRGRVRYLSDDERSRLLRAAEMSDKNPYLYTIVVVALCTGGRKSEILSLKWTDVDLDPGFVQFTNTKNGDDRLVPLATPALQALKDHHADYHRPGSSWVFGRGRGDRAPTLDYRHFQEAVRDAQITDFKFHDLRHSAASYLAMSGAQLLDIAAILGHRNIAMTQRYAHLSREHLVGVVNTMAEQRMG